MHKLLVAFATALHLLPHPFGVSPVGASALYAGAYGDKKSSWAVPLIPLIAAALLFGFYEPLVMVSVFLGFALATLPGRWILGKERTRRRFGAAVVSGAAIFFVVSNFGNWLAFSDYYAPGLAGLVQCYINGLPFFGVAIVADALYCGVLFGLHHLIDNHQPAAAHA